MRDSNAFQRRSQDRTAQSYNDGPIGTHLKGNEMKTAMNNLNHSRTNTQPENRDRQPRMKRNLCTGFPETRKRDFEQEATERTEIQKEASLFPSLTSVQIRLPFIRVMFSFESALYSLCYLLFRSEE